MLEAVLAGLFGLLIGSFLNVCIHRMPRDLSVVHPRSFCPQCERPIAWYDNIPLLTFIVLGGRCRYCRGPIPWRYPAVELLTGILFFICILGLGPTAVGAKFCVFSAIQVALIFTDLEARILPDEFTLGGTVAGLIFAGFVPMPYSIFSLLLPEDWSSASKSVGEAAMAALFLAGLLWVIGSLYQRIRGREGLGFGDVKMVACIGAFLGLGPALFVLAIGNLLGLVIGLGYIYLARKNVATYELPLGTFLGIAALIVGLPMGPFSAFGAG